MALIQAITTIPHRLRFLCTADKLQCVHILAHVGIQLSPHFIHWDNSFSGSINFIHLKIALGLALGESWPLLAQG